MNFTEFTPQMLDFLAENQIRNSKDWYEEHKPECRKLVIEPFHHLVEHMAPTMLSIDPLFEVTPYKCTARVRRDNRYTKNKDLYRDHLWISFRHPKKRLSEGISFYVDVMQDSWGYGVGCYGMRKSMLDECREMILHEDLHFVKAYEAMQRPDFLLFGEEYKRIQFPDAPEKYQPWLQKKQLGIDFRSDDFDALFSGAFYDKMIEDIKAMQPFYSFLQKAEERSRANSHREDIDEIYSN